MLNELTWGIVEVIFYSFFKKAFCILINILKKMKICGLKYARAKYNPSLAPLQRMNEDKEAFSSLPPSVILIRWINHHLRKNSMRTINNLSDDLEVFFSSSFFFFNSFSLLPFPPFVVLSFFSFYSFIIIKLLIIIEKDGENYVFLMEAIAPGSVPRKQQLVNEQDWESRASAILRAAKLLGCRMLITPRDISEV